MSERKSRKRPRRDTGPPVVEDAKSGSDYDIIAMSPYALGVLVAILTIARFSSQYWVRQEIVHWLAAPEMIEIYLVTLGQGYYSALKALTADTIARFPDAVIHLAQIGHENMKLVGPYKMSVLETLLENMGQRRATQIENILETLLENMGQRRATQIENRKVTLENTLCSDVASIVDQYLGEYELNSSSKIHHWPDGEYRECPMVPMVHPSTLTTTHQDSRFWMCSVSSTTAKQVVANVDLRQLSKYESFRKFLINDLQTTFTWKDKDVKGLRVRLNTTTCATHEDLWQTMLALSPIIYYNKKYY